MEKQKPLTIGIVGCGFVGSAVNYGFPGTARETPEDNKIAEVAFGKASGCYNILNHPLTKVLIDPRFGTTISKDLEPANPSFVFVAVPTPMGDDGVIDSRLIEETVTQLSTLKSNPVIIIKSTITPAVVDKLLKISPRIVYNPEFLTERNANDDFIHAELHVFGGNTADVMAVHALYTTYSRCVMSEAKVVYVDAKAASMIKYTLNNFLAVKVTFFNMLKDIYEKSGTHTSWYEFITALGFDSRIGSSHMQVPGHDGKLGFGGSCFVKDSAAMLHFARSVDQPFTILEEAIKVNQKIRSRYDLDDREKAMNVKFDMKL